MKAFAEKLLRLTEMKLPEIRFRATQKLRIAREQWQDLHGGRFQETGPWWRYWDADKISDPALRAAVRREDEAEAAQLLSTYFAKRKPPSFYWDLSLRKKLAATHRQFFPGRVEQIGAEADAICKHCFRIFGYPEVCCGTEVAWRRDLVNCVESGLEHYSRISYLEFTKVGDSKVTWELNRHQHLLTLAQAHLLTGAERYAEECVAQLEHWRRENPYARGINWASSLEVSFRSWSWLWVLHLLSGSRALTGARIGELTAAIARNAEFVAANLSIYFSPNTHLLGEGFALFAIGLLLPELRGSERWRDCGRAILLEQMEKQVREDGSHFEQSTYYHRYAVEFFLCAAILAERNECPFPSAYRERLERMVEFLRSISLPTGRDPMIGDSDGGRLIAFGPNEPNDWCPVLSTAALHFHNGNFLPATKGFDEQALWLLGPDSFSGLINLEPAPPREASRTFPNAGLVAMRSDWSARAKHLLFDAGPQGVGACAHGHADALAFVCSADGINWLVDPGTYIYTASRPWRDFFRSTRAHNTVVIDEKDQARPVDFFKWRALPEVRVERSVSTDVLDYTVGVHSGYVRLSQPVQHRRQIIFAKPDYWIISDELVGKGTHHLEFFFHFAPGVVIQQKDNRWFASKNGETFLLIAAAPGVSFRIATGEESPSQGWYSEDYGHREPAPVLVGSIHAAVPARFDWLLMPAPAGSGRLRRCEPGRLNLAVETDAWSDFFVGSGEASEVARAKISTDAELAFGRQRLSGEFARLAVISGSSLEVGGLKILQADKKLDELSVTWSAEGLAVRARPAIPFRLYAPGATKARLNGKEATAARADNWITFEGES